MPENSNPRALDVGEAVLSPWKKTVDSPGLRGVVMERFWRTRNGTILAARADARGFQLYTPDGEEDGKNETLSSVEYQAEAADEWLIARIQKWTAVWSISGDLPTRADLRHARDRRANGPVIRDLPTLGPWEALGTTAQARYWQYVPATQAAAIVFESFQGGQEAKVWSSIGNLIDTLSTFGLEGRVWADATLRAYAKTGHGTQALDVSALGPPAQDDERLRVRLVRALREGGASDLPGDPTDEAILAAIAALQGRANRPAPAFSLPASILPEKWVASVEDGPLESMCVLRSPTDNLWTGRGWEEVLRAALYQLDTHIVDVQAQAQAQHAARSTSPAEPAIPERIVVAAAAHCLRMAIDDPTATNAERAIEAICHAARLLPGA